MTLSREALLDALTDAIASPDEALARVPDVLLHGPAPVLLAERQIAAAVEAVMALQRSNASRRNGKAATRDPDAPERIRLALVVLGDDDLEPRSRVTTAGAVLHGDTILDRSKRGAR